MNVSVQYLENGCLLVQPLKALPQIYGFSVLFLLQARKPEGGVSLKEQSMNN